jgi:recombinase
MADPHGRPQDPRQGEDKGNGPDMGRPHLPPWLKLTKKTPPERIYEISHNRAAAVLWMFLASANGLVDSKIAEMMPKRFKWSKKWEPRDIAKILKDRAVMGENQRYKMIDGKRRPVGKPEKNLFPSIVQLHLFDRVQKARSLPRTGDLANLFAASAKCECCDQPMKHRSKKVKGNNTELVLVCKNRKRCPAYNVEWPYLDFERLFYRFAEEIDDRGLIREQTLDDAAAIELEIKFLQEEKNAKQEELNQLKSRIAEINNEIAKRMREKRELSIGHVEPRQAISDEDYRLRARKAARIREVVKELYLAAEGTRPRLADRIQLIRKTVKTDPDITNDLVKGLDDLENKPYFLAKFEDGREVTVIPNKNEREGIEWSESMAPIKLGLAKARVSKDVLPPVKLLLRYTIPDKSFALPRLTIAISGDGAEAAANEVGSKSVGGALKT